MGVGQSKSEKIIEIYENLKTDRYDNVPLPRKLFINLEKIKDKLDLKKILNDIELNKSNDDFYYDMLKTDKYDEIISYI